jgi:L-ascorbate 6-phosphate lactonase
MPLMQEIRGLRVPAGSIGIWWFGQNGFIFKSPEGTLAAVDLYLTDSCAKLIPEMNMSRQVPVLVRPDELDVDVFACTHNHQDHTDPETIRNLRNKGTMQFVGPHPSCDVYRAEGVESGRIVPSWPDCDIEHRDLRIRGTFALPTDTSDLNHMGFVFQFGNGPKVYVTGDTAPTELLLGVTKHSPDIVITVINGGFYNLSHWQAADLVGKIQPKVAIPCHYDMFPDNSADPKQFRAAMQLRAPDVKYQQMSYGTPLIFP